MKYFFIFLICFAIITSLQAQPGTLDMSFGKNGIVLTDGIYDGCNAMTIQQDGKIILAGTNYNGTGNVFQLIRYNTDGSIDFSFGFDGRVLTDLSGSTFEQINSVSIQSDGKIVAAGIVYHDIAIVRYMENGSVDTSFGNEGSVITDLRNEDYLTDMALQADSKIIVTGKTKSNDNDIQTSFILRYMPDGRPDASFGEKGKVLTVFNEPVNINAITVQPDGKILTGGISNYLTPFSKFLVARYLADGSLDKEFGQNGLATTGFENIAESAGILDIAAEGDGKIITVGGSEAIEGFQQNMTLVRFQNTGAVDSSFGKNGIVITNFGETDPDIYSIATDVLLQPDEKIIAAGRSYKYATFSNLALARYQTNGNLDSSFAEDGMQTTNMGGGTYCAGVALQTDGKIVVAGTTNLEPSSSHFSIARYNNDVVLPITYTRFTAQQNGQYITLNWQTVQETNNAYFAVEHSSNANSYAELGKVNSTGTIAGIQNYFYRDNVPVIGNNYYRLKQVDKDGKFSYSEVVSISYVKPGSIKVYPNPGREMLTIEGLNGIIYSTLSVVDIQGRLLQQFTVKASTYSFNISRLTPGTYLLRMTDNQGTSTAKFVKK